MRLAAHLVYCCGLCMCIEWNVVIVCIYYLHSQNPYIMSEDTPLLHPDDGEEAADDKPKLDCKQMVWFHGKVSTVSTTQTKQ